jgi:hypothetical protein
VESSSSSDSSPLGNHPQVDLNQPMNEAEMEEEEHHIPDPSNVFQGLYVSSASLFIFTPINFGM